MEQLDRERRNTTGERKWGDIHDEDAAVVDIEAAYAVVRVRWARRDPSVEMKMNFKLFTDTDHITADNLRRVAQELGDAGQVGDDQIRAMIEVFDKDLDGKISLREFTSMMTPAVD